MGCNGSRVKPFHSLGSGRRGGRNSNNSNGTARGGWLAGGDDAFKSQLRQGLRGNSTAPTSTSVVEPFRDTSAVVSRPRAGLLPATAPSSSSSSSSSLSSSSGGSEASLQSVDSVEAPGPPPPLPPAPPPPMAVSGAAEGTLRRGSLHNAAALAAPVGEAAAVRSSKPAAPVLAMQRAGSVPGRVGGAGRGADAAEESARSVVEHPDARRLSTLAATIAAAAGAAQSTTMSEGTTTPSSSSGSTHGGPFSPSFYSRPVDLHRLAPLIKERLRSGGGSSRIPEPAKLFSGTPGAPGSSASGSSSSSGSSTPDAGHQVGGEPVIIPPGVGSPQLDMGSLNLSHRAPFLATGVGTEPPGKVLSRRALESMRASETRTGKLHSRGTRGGHSSSSISSMGSSAQGHRQGQGVGAAPPPVLAHHHSSNSNNHSSSSMGSSRSTGSRPSSSRSSAKRSGSSSATRRHRAHGHAHGHHKNRRSSDRSSSERVAHSFLAGGGDTSGDGPIPSLASSQNSANMLLEDLEEFEVEEDYDPLSTLDRVSPVHRPKKQAPAARQAGRRANQLSMERDSLVAGQQIPGRSVDSATLLGSTAGRELPQALGMAVSSSASAAANRYGGARSNARKGHVPGSAGATAAAACNPELFRSLDSDQVGGGKLTLLQKRVLKNRNANFLQGGGGSANSLLQPSTVMDVVSPVSVDGAPWDQRGHLPQEEPSQQQPRVLRGILRGATSSAGGPGAGSRRVHFAPNMSVVFYKKQSCVEYISRAHRFVLGAVTSGKHKSLPKDAPEPPSVGKGAGGAGEGPLLTIQVEEEEDGDSSRVPGGGSLGSGGRSEVEGGVAFAGGLSSVLQQQQQQQQQQRPPPPGSAASVGSSSQGSPPHLLQHYQQVQRGIRDQRGSLADMDATMLLMLRPGDRAADSPVVANSVGSVGSSSTTSGSRRRIQGMTGGLMGEDEDDDEEEEGGGGGGVVGGGGGEKEEGESAGVEGEAEEEPVLLPEEEEVGRREIQEFMEQHPPATSANEQTLTGFLR